MNSSRLRGTGVALVTPFRSGPVNYAAFAEMTERLIASQVDFLVPLGSTGEASTLSKTEKEYLLNLCIEANAGRKPIVAGLGGSNTQELKKHLQSFDYSAVDAIMISTPPYNKPTQEGLYAHFMQLAEVSPKPILIYNIPSRTCSNLLPQTVLRLAKTGKEQFIGIKEASGQLEQIMTLLAQKPQDFLVLAGDDILALPLIACGADGVVSVMANALPDYFSSMVRHALAHEWEEARKRHHTLLPLNKLLYQEGNPAGIKGALEALGLCSRETRLPLLPLSDELFQKIEREVLRIARRKT